MAEVQARLRFRVYVARQVVDEQWADLITGRQSRALGTELGQRQVQIAMAAASEGFPWMVEVYDPSAEPEDAYIRFGTDWSMMERPEPVGNNFYREVTKRWRN